MSAHTQIKWLQLYQVTIKRVETMQTIQCVNMVKSQLGACGITQKAVLKAFQSIPRDFFVPTSEKKYAYSDAPIFFEDQRFMVRPLSLALLMEAADLCAHDHVLDLGCGTGYSTALLGSLCHDVVGVEDHASLASQAQGLLKTLHLDSVEVFQGPLKEGFPAKAPYDVIALQGAVEEVPQALLGQLRKETGRLVGFFLRPQGPVLVRIQQVQGTYVTTYGVKEDVPVLRSFETFPSFEF